MLEIDNELSSSGRKAEYRDLLDQIDFITRSEEIISATTTSRLDKILGRANTLFQDSDIEERIQHTDEILLDAKLIANASTVLLNATQSIDCTVDKYEPEEFSRRIISKMTTEELNTVAINALKLPPLFFTMHGAIDLKEKPMKIRQHRTRKLGEAAEKKEPERIKNVDKEEDSVDDTVKFLLWALNKEFERTGGEPINYFQFLIVPNDFSASIQNMFHLSFLVRDGKARLSSDDDETVLDIIPVTGGELKQVKKGHVPYRQTITSIDLNDWKKLIEKYKIKKCLLDKWKLEWTRRK